MQTWLHGLGDLVMSGFTEKRASDASEQPSGEPVVLTWGAAGAMLPLVERIAADVVRQHDRLALLQPEKNRLDRNRWNLAWPERASAIGCKKRRPTPRKNYRTRPPNWKCWGCPCCTAQRH